MAAPTTILIQHIKGFCSKASVAYTFDLPKPPTRVVFPKTPTFPDALTRKLSCSKEKDTVPEKLEREENVFLIKEKVRKDGLFLQKWAESDEPGDNSPTNNMRTTPRLVWIHKTKNPPNDYGKRDHYQSTNFEMRDFICLLLRVLNIDTVFRNFGRIGYELLFFVPNITRFIGLILFLQKKASFSHIFFDKENLFFPFKLLRNGVFFFGAREFSGESNRKCGCFGEDHSCGGFWETESVNGKGLRKRSLYMLDQYGVGAAIFLVRAVIWEEMMMDIGE